MASLRGMSVMLALAILFAACFTAQGQYYNNYGGGGASAYASASASASSGSYGGRGGYGNNGYGNNGYGGGYGGDGHRGDGYGGGGYGGGRRNCFLGFCLGFGKRLLSIQSFQDFQGSLGFSKGNTNVNVVPSHTMIETQLDSIMEYPDRVYIDILVPGLLPGDDVSAELQDGTLLVTGKIQQSTNDCKSTGEDASCKSTSSASFSHSISVPGKIDLARITTKMADGVVRVKLPKE